MFSILKLKRAKNYPTDFFSRDRQKFQASQKLTRIYQTQENLIKINTNLYSIKQKIN
jgi:hypothetical protein